MTMALRQIPAAAEELATFASPRIRQSDAELLIQEGTLSAGMDLVH